MKIPFLKISEVQQKQHVREIYRRIYQKRKKKLKVTRLSIRLKKLEKEQQSEHKDKGNKDQKLAK